MSFITEGLPGREGLWEEYVITSPPHKQIIGLSALLPDALQLVEWMQSVTGRPTKLIVAPGARPVPLKYFFATRERQFPLFRNPDTGPVSPLCLLGSRLAFEAMVFHPKVHLTKQTSRKMSDLETTHIKPALKIIVQRKMQKVNRMMERPKERPVCNIKQMPELILLGQ